MIDKLRKFLGMKTAEMREPFTHTIPEIGSQYVSVARNPFAKSLYYKVIELRKNTDGELYVKVEMEWVDFDAATKTVTKKSSYSTTVSLLLADCHFDEMIKLEAE